MILMYILHITIGKVSGTMISLHIAKPTLPESFQHPPSTIYLAALGKSLATWSKLGGPPTL